MIAVTATATPHTCAMRTRSDRQVFCWGYNEQGQCGAGFTSVNLGASINDLGNNFKAFNLGTGEFPHHDRADLLHLKGCHCKVLSGGEYRGIENFILTCKDHIIV